MTVELPASDPKPPKNAAPNVTTVPDRSVVDCMVSVYLKLKFPPFRRERAVIVFPLGFNPDN